MSAFFVEHNPAIVAPASPAAAAQTAPAASRRRGRRHALNELAPPTRFDYAIEWVLGALLIFAPLALGAVEPWSEWVVSLLAAAMVAILAIKLVVRRGDERFVWTWAYVPVVLFAALLALQLVQLPAALVGAVAPQTLALKRELLAGLPDADAALKHVTLSFYPHATVHDLRLVLVASAAFVVVVNVYRRPGQIKRLLTIVAAVGGAVAALALMQDLSGAGEIYWSIPGGAAARGGPFVNQNNFAQYMNLCVGGGLALLLIQRREIERGDGTGTESWGAADRKVRWLWWLGAMIVAGGLSVLLSMSRMGVISTLAAGGAAAVLLNLALRRRGKQGGAGAGGAWILAPIALVLFVGLLAAGFDKVYDRLATLHQLEQADSGSRWRTLQDLTWVYRRFPVLGIGSGSHETFYPMIDSHPDLSLTAHVEDEYAQVLEETGALGAAMVLAFLLILGRNAIQALRGESVWTRGATVGLCYAIIAVLIHSASDFGQRLPAVATLSAVTCGLLIVLGQRARLARREDSAAPATQRMGFLPLRLSGGLVAVAVMGWGLWGASIAWAADGHWSKADAAQQWLGRNDWVGTDEEFKQLLDDAAAAASLQPGNVEYRHQQIIFRWRQVTRERAPETGALIFSEKDLADVRQIVQDLHAARAICPTYGGNLSLAGQLERFVLDDAAAGSAHVRQGYKLSPNNPTARFAAGLLDAIEGKWDDSLQKFARLPGGMFDDVLEVYLNQTDRPDLALIVAADDTTKLFRLAQALQSRPATEGTNADASKALATEAKSKAVAKIKAQAAGPGAAPATLVSAASILAAEGDRDQAIAYYRKALESDYGNIPWRSALARLLAAGGRIDEAMTEARVCLRLRPQDAGVKQLIQDVSVAPRPKAQE